MKENSFLSKISVVLLGILLIVFGQYIAPLMMNGIQLNIVSNVSFWLGIIICVVWFMTYASKVSK